MAKSKSKARRSSKNSTDNMDDSGEILEIDCCPYQALAEENVCDNRGYDNRRLGTGSHHRTLNEKQKNSFDSVDSGYFGSGAKCKDETSCSIQSMCSTMESVSLTDDTITSISESVNETACKRTKRTSSNSEIRLMFEPDSDGDTQLHMAIINLLTAIAIYIINRAPSVDLLNIPNKLLQTPLHLAVTVRASDIVHWLLFRCADRQARDRNGDTPLHIASKAGYDEIANMLLTVNTGVKRKKMFQCVNSKNYGGKTCLHVAAEGTHLSTLKLLIENGANINITESKSGRTILHYAAETGNAILLEYLLQTPEVDINSKTYGGYTPVMLAHGRGFRDIEFRLRQAGADMTWFANSDTDSDEDMEL